MRASSCASLLRVSVARLRGLMFYHQRRLCEREQEDQWDDAPHFERYPGRSGRCTPHRFVDSGKAEEKYTPAHGQFFPSRFVEVEGLRENIFDEQTVECQ